MLTESQMCCLSEMYESMLKTPFSEGHDSDRPNAIAYLCVLIHGHLPDKYVLFYLDLLRESLDCASTGQYNNLEKIIGIQQYVQSTLPDVQQNYEQRDGSTLFP